MMVKVSKNKRLGYNSTRHSNDGLKNVLAVDFEAAQKNRQKQINHEELELKKAEKTKSLSQQRRERRQERKKLKRQRNKERKKLVWATNNEDFLSSFKWRRLRLVILKKYGPKCMCCGSTPESGAVMNVDHIKPRAKYPELALDPDNLQILCDACNHGKGNWDETDWRPTE